MLLSPSEFEAVISGRRRGVAAGCLRGLFSLAEKPYTLAVRWRNRRYDRGSATVHRVGVPVVSVGNLTLGGTGKTPLVVWLARWYAGRDIPVGLVSRGYRAKPGSANDEALELERELPGVPHVQNPDRVAAARELLAKRPCGVIVMDDGFQHRRLHRDLDIVLLDALAPLGHGHVFPRGTLREPASGLARAQCVILSRADLIGETARQQIREVVAKHSPGACWAEAVHAPLRLVGPARETAGLDSLRDQPIAAFCGIGNPQAFRHTLSTCGYRIAAFREYPDHHHYDASDWEDLLRWSAAHGASSLVCTQKDLVKLAFAPLDDRPLWALQVGLQFTAGQEPLERLLQATLRP